MSPMLARRLTRPAETARLLAIRWLPLGLRWRLLGLVAPLRRLATGGPDPAAWQRELDVIAPPPSAPPVDPWLGGDSLPRVSVLIVTHDNAGLTALCLDSLDRFTAYPDLEVVVVDNASSDDTPAMLRARAASDPRLMVVLEPVNRGFAAGCNRAAREASGEVLCFLNNDTVLTPGWLGPLVTTLEDEPGVGLVGPVSNGVANEARVRGSYRTLAELLAFAEDHARRHRGRSFSIPMLALYCAALRRSVWEQVGPLDEAFGLGLFEDDDYARRLRRAGLDLVCHEEAFVHHWQQASFDRMARQRYLELYERNRRYLREKWSAETGSGSGGA